MKMKRLRGFRLGRKLVKLFRMIDRPRRILTRNPFSQICSLAWHLGLGQNSGAGYIRLGQGGRKMEVVPKGHLAVYLSESGCDTRRVVVPVMYFNHPLFGELLAQTERVHGFNHPGGITIPCGISEFEKIKARIAGWDRCRSRQLGLNCSRF